MPPCKGHVFSSFTLISWSLTIWDGPAQVSSTRTNVTKVSRGQKRRRKGCLAAQSFHLSRWKKLELEALPSFQTGGHSCLLSPSCIQRRNAAVLWLCQKPVFSRRRLLVCPPGGGCGIIKYISWPSDSISHQQEELSWCFGSIATWRFRQHLGWHFVRTTLCSWSLSFICRIERQGAGRRYNHTWIAQLLLQQVRRWWSGAIEEEWLLQQGWLWPGGVATKKWLEHSWDELRIYRFGCEQKRDRSSCGRVERAEEKKKRGPRLQQEKMKGALSVETGGACP